MVDTIKFSQMTSGGDLSPNEPTPGLLSGANVLFNNPFPLLAPGSTADRPVIAPTMYYRLRFNTTLEAYEYYSPTLTAWVQLEDSSGNYVGPFVTFTSSPDISGNFDLGSLTSGLLKQSVLAGVATPAIAISGTDYWAPGDALTRTQAPVIGDDVTNKTYVDAQIATSGAFIGWLVTAGTTQAMAAKYGYIAQNAAQTVFTTPAIAPVGTIVAVQGLGAGGWVIQANTGQTIKGGSLTTTVAGTVTSNASNDNAFLVCVVADSVWQVTSTYSQGLDYA